MHYRNRYQNITCAVWNKHWSVSKDKWNSCVQIRHN